MIHLIHIHWIKILGISELVVLTPVLANSEKFTHLQGDSLNESLYKKSCPVYFPHSHHCSELKQLVWTNLYMWTVKLDNINAIANNYGFPNSIMQFFSSTEAYMPKSLKVHQIITL